MSFSGNGMEAFHALFGAWVCGACLGAVGMSLHHKRCHVLGGAFGIPHAETHIVILPQRRELLPRFARSVCRSPIWTRPPRRRSNPRIGIRAPSSGMQFANSQTTLITDAGLLEGEARTAVQHF